MIYIEIKESETEKDWIILSCTCNKEIVYTWVKSSTAIFTSSFGKYHPAFNTEELVDAFNESAKQWGIETKFVLSYGKMYMVASNGIFSYEPCVHYYIDDMGNIYDAMDENYMEHVEFTNFHVTDSNTIKRVTKKLNTKWGKKTSW